MIYKYPVHTADVMTLQLPAGAEVLCVQVQESDEQPYVWVLLNERAPDDSLVPFVFHRIGTGHSIDPQLAASIRHIGTYQQLDGLLVWHLFLEI